MQLPLRGLLVGAGLLASPAVLAQAVRADSAATAATTSSLRQYYTAALGYESRLYNGPEYVNYVRRYVVGHQFFESKEARPATIEYAGATYTGVPLRYDIVRDELVLNSPQGNLDMLLVKDKVSRFIVGGHAFVLLTAATANGTLPARPGFYELLVEGPVRLLALRYKDLQERASAGALEGEITEKDEFFLFRKGRYTKAGKAGTVLAVLPEHKAALRKYIRTEKLKFGAAKREKSLVALVRYAATLTSAPSPDAGR